jgi:imidazole glycerol-phosphate synthase subunit HisH
MKNQIFIVDYGVGNLRSVANACIAVGCEPIVSSRPAELRSAQRIILPGVGAFADAMANLRAAGWIGSLEEEVRGKGKPFLGICLGMQLLATISYELGAHPGLNWIPGTVERIKTPEARLPVPHIGWNDVRPTDRKGLYAGHREVEAFYFLHSYVFKPANPAVVSGQSSYGENFVASVELGAIYGTQYHPEKSQRAGLTVLKNFSEVPSPLHA